MFVALNPVVGLAGSWVFRPQPPRGTPSRITRRRLWRCFQPVIRIRGRSITTSISPVSAPLCVSLPAPFPRCSRRSLRNDSSNGYVTLREASVKISRDHVSFLNDMLNLFPDGPQRRSPSNPPLVDFRTQGVHVYFQKALKALRQQDTRALLIHLRRITLLSEADIRDSLRALPRTTITEFFRLLDPLCVARDADPTDGARISKGMYVLLNLESTMDEWGIRKLYLRLLERVTWLTNALMDAGLVLRSEEYRCLMRCAGAAADIATATWAFNLAKHTGELYWRRSDLYCEFIRARFLTEPLYRGYNKALSAVRARDLHRSKVMLPFRRRKYLDRLRLKLRKRTARFGLNKERDYAEDLGRRLRSRRPVLRLFRYICKRGRHMIDERLLCAFIIAFAQNGSLRMIGSHILEDFFGIRVARLNLDHITIANPQGNIYAVPRLVATPIRPSVLLMETVAYAYGLNGEIAIAVELIDYISRTHKLPVQLKVWQSLLEWTYISSSPPFSSAWKKANMDASKVPPPGTIEILWSTMTAPPYNIRPGFDQYAVLIRDLLSRNRLEPAVPYIREARRFYIAQCHEFEDAVFEYVQALRSGLSGVAISAPLHRYERARFRKQSMWYDLQSWTRRVLLKWRTVGTSVAVPEALFRPETVMNMSSWISYQMIPDFVREFGPGGGQVGNRGGPDNDVIGDGFSDDLLPHPVRYRTPTGYVQLVDPCREFVRLVHEDSRAVDVPIPVSPSKFASLKLSPDDLIVTGAIGKAGHNVRLRVLQKRVTVLSRHSLAPMVASRIDPLTLLDSTLSNFMTKRWRPRRRRIINSREQVAWAAEQHLEQQEGMNEQDIDDDDYF